jgi:cell shape-determining protein MreD
MLDAAKAAVAVFVLAILQLSAMPLIIPGSAAPDLLLILVVAVALTRGAEAAALTGFAAGLLLDAMLVGRLGISSLLYIGAGLWVAYRVEPSESAVVAVVPAPPSRARRYAYLLIAAALVQIGLAAAHVLLGDGYPLRYTLSQIAIPTVVETAIVSLVALPLLCRLFPYRLRLDGYPVATA